MMANDKSTAQVGMQFQHLMKMGKLPTLVHLKSNEKGKYQSTKRNKNRECKFEVFANIIISSLSLGKQT